ncbi:MAG: TonB-dependent receptor plug domain-containing protein, partial [Opitutaceae bacterium]
MAVAMALSQAALAQTEQLSEIVVTGTRRADVSATESLSPIDIVDGSDIAQQAAFDLTDSLTRISPSINTQRYPIADGTSFIRPVSLRNLSPDHTLVLVNGARRHRSALVNLQLAPLGTVNQGSQGIDWSTFPAGSIERVEVLRDGASAQYGSDAIAGVINVILKDASEGGSLSAQYGSYSGSEGERLSVAGNIGLPLGSEGFVNLSGEYSTADE